MSAKTYDPACYALAEHFIGSKPEHEKARDLLAKHLQSEVETWLEFDDDSPQKEPKS